MHRRIDTTLRQLRQDPCQYLDRSVVERICLRRRDVRRDGVLTPFATLHWFLLQVLSGHTGVHVATLAKKAFTDSAYCQRARAFPWRSFGRAPSPHHGLRSGYPRPPVVRASHVPARRVLVLDARHPRVAAVVRPARRTATGLRVSRRQDLGSVPRRHGAVARSDGRPFCFTRPRSAEDVHPALQPGDVLVADRGFCSFAHLALLMARGIHAVFRMHQQQIVDFTPDRPHARRGDKAAGTGLPRSKLSAGWARSTNSSNGSSPNRSPSG